MKRLHLLLLAAIFAISAITVTPAMAEHEHGVKGQCEMCEKGGMGYGRHDDKDGKDCPILSKTMKKAKFFLKNSKEIALSDDQVAQIKTIKLETKKAMIRMAADMELFELDLDTKLSEPKVDVEGLNAMLDTAAAGWGTGAKASVATYAKLKAVLNDAQMAKAKELWTKDADEKHDSHGK